MPRHGPLVRRPAGRTARAQAPPQPTNPGEARPPTRCDARASLHARVHSASVIVQMSVTRMAALLPAVVSTLMMLAYVVSSVVTNLRVLKAQLLVLRSFNIDATTTPAFIKYHMFVALAFYTTAYFLVMIGLIVAQTISPQTPWFATLLRQLLELITCALIGYVFRPKPLNVIFEQMHQLAATLADEMLPDITTLTIDVNELRGEDTIPWSREIDLKDTPRSLPPRAAGAPAATTSAGGGGGGGGGGGAAQPAPAAGRSPTRGAGGRADANGPPDLLMVINPSDWMAGDDENDTAAFAEKALVFATRERTGAEKRRAATRPTAARDDYDDHLEVPLPMATLRQLFEGSIRLPEWRGSAAVSPASMAMELDAYGGRRSSSRASGPRGRGSRLWGARADARVAPLAHGSPSPSDDTGAGVSLPPSPPAEDGAERWADGGAGGAVDAGGGSSSTHASTSTGSLRDLEC